MTDFEKFKEELPSREKFYSSLIDRKISDKEYEHVVNVWKKIEMKAMKGYHNLYLKSDVLLLADEIIIALRMMDYVQVIIRAHQV